MPNWGAMAAGAALGGVSGYAGQTQMPGPMMRPRPKFDPTMARNAGARIGVQQQQQQMPQPPDAGGMQTNPYELPDYMNGPLPPPSGMAGGGIVTQPTTALIGEQGPEMVIPLSGRQPGARVGPSNAMGMNYRRG